jgi:LysR family transcriptional regulator, hydrogen peroxide-inducible genes activator
MTAAFSRFGLLVPRKCSKRELRDNAESAWFLYDADGREAAARIVSLDEARLGANGGAEMEMHEIRYFLAVCETLNFTRAAERCNVTQPALTRAIQKMEDELGGLLFRRERSRTHLTDLGRIIRPQLEEVARRSEAVKAAARDFLKLDNAPLKLGVMCTIGPMRFMSFLAKFRSEHPGIELTLTEGVPEQLGKMLLGGDLDLAVMAQPELFNERLDLRLLYREPFVIAFPPGHRFAQMNAVPIAEVSGENYLLRVNCEYKDFIGDICQSYGFTTHKVYRSEREDWIQAMVLAGMGVCFLPAYSPVIQGLQTRMVVDPEVTRDVSLASIAGRRFSPAVASFVRAIEAYRWPGEET